MGMLTTDPDTPEGAPVHSQGLAHPVTATIISLWLVARETEASAIQRKDVVEAVPKGAATTFMGVGGLKQSIEGGGVPIRFKCLYHGVHRH